MTGDIGRNSNNVWISFEWLGFLLGTNEDIKRRKELGHDSYSILTPYSAERM